MLFIRAVIIGINWNVVRANIWSTWFWACALNIIGMILCLAMDFERGWNSSFDPYGVFIVNIVTCAIFVVDSILFTLSYRVFGWDTLLSSSVPVLAEVFNNLASIFYMVTSVIFFRSRQRALAETVFVIELFGAFSYLLSSIFYYWDWLRLKSSDKEDESAKKSHGRRKKRYLFTLSSLSSFLTLDFWVAFLNVVPSVIYTSSAIASIVVAFSSVAKPSKFIEDDSSSSLDDVGFNSSPFSTFITPSTDHAMHTLARIYIYGDIIWLIDAFLGLWQWYLSMLEMKEEYLVSQSDREDFSSKVSLLSNSQSSSRESPISWNTKQIPV